MVFLQENMAGRNMSLACQAQVLALNIVVRRARKSCLPLACGQISQPYPEGMYGKLIAHAAGLPNDELLRR